MRRKKHINKREYELLGSVFDALYQVRDKLPVLSEEACELTKALHSITEVRYIFRRLNRIDL